MTKKFDKMRICYGWARKPMNLSNDKRYHPEQLMARLSTSKPAKPASPLLWMPVWIHLDNVFVRLHSKEEIELACKLACIYHNGPDNRAAFESFDEGDFKDWQYVTEKEVFLAGVRTPEPESSESEE